MSNGEELTVRKRKSRERQQWYREQLARPSATRGIIEEYIKMVHTEHQSNGVQFHESNFEIRSFLEEGTRTYQGRTRKNTKTVYVVSENGERLKKCKNKDECLQELDRIIHERVNAGWVVIGLPSDRYRVI
jgi:hypothetical protein